MMKMCHTPGCSGVVKDLFSVKDLNRRVNSNRFNYIQCECCKVIRLANIPDDLGDYYQDDYYIFPAVEQLNKISSANTFKIEIVKRFKASGKLLEIGPAYGVFSFQAKRAGFDVDVIEMDEKCCEHLTKVVGVNAICSALPHNILPTLPAYDVIALWHVIEHLRNPWALISSAADNLADDGILVLAAPNPDAWQFRIMGKAWPHVDAPRHLYLLPSKALIKYASTLGLECIHYSTTDIDAKSWNRFGWQRFLMNQVSNKWLEKVCFVIGYIASVLMAPFEIFGNKGSAYTIIFHKTNTKVIN